MWASNYSPTTEHVLQTQFAQFYKKRKNKVIDSVPAVTFLAGAVSMEGLSLNNFILEQEVQIVVDLIEELSDK